MTISSETYKKVYTGDGVTLVFAYNFKIFEDTDLEVLTQVIATGVETTLTLTTDYTVSGAGEDAGGNVTLLIAAPASTSYVIIRRSVPYKQETDYSDYDSFPAETHEDALDKLTMLTQQLLEQTQRSVLQDSSATTPLTLPTPEVGKLLVATAADELDWTDPTTPYPPTGTFCFTIDGFGFVLSTGIALDFVIPFDLTLTDVTMLADQSGSAVIDLWVDEYDNYPPTVADTITASAKPTITTATNSQDTTLTGWTTDLDEGSTLRVNVDSCTTITRLCVSLSFTRR